MKFSSREDIEAPIDYVFARVSDFAAFERRALRMGAAVSRTDVGEVSAGSGWDVAFKFRGKERQLKAVLTTFDIPHRIQMNMVSGGIDGVSIIEVVPLSPKRTRVAISTDLKANTLTARLLLQSMKLAKAKLVRRFKGRVLDFAEDIEDDYRRGL